MRSSASYVQYGLLAMLCSFLRRANEQRDARLAPKNAGKKLGAEICGINSSSEAIYLRVCRQKHMTLRKESARTRFFESVAQQVMCDPAVCWNVTLQLSLNV